MKSIHLYSRTHLALTSVIVASVLSLGASGLLAPFASAATGGPTVILSSTTSSPTSVTMIPITAVFSESVTGLATSSIAATNGTVSDLSGSGTTFTFNLNPSSTGTTSVMIPADMASSTASSTGNQASNKLDFAFTMATSTGTSSLPMISNVAATSTGTTSEMISWMTDTPASTWVLYGTTTTYGLATPFDVTPATNHIAFIAGLATSTLYHYAVVSGNVMGTSTSPDQSFTTSASSTSATSTATSTLAVTGVDTITSVAIANGVFTDGWKWVLHLTVPDTEDAFRMKFGDFLNAAASSTIPIANNIRMFSPQSSNAIDENSAITETNNNYGGWMTLTGDTSSTTAGRQIDVTIEMRVPSGTASGTYTTSFGAQSVPSAATSTTP